MDKNIDLTAIVNEGYVSLARRAAESLEIFRTSLTSVSGRERTAIDDCKTLLDKISESGAAMLDDVQYEHFTKIRELCEVKIPAALRPTNHESLLKTTFDAFLAYRKDIPDRIGLISHMGLSAILADDYTGCITVPASHGQNFQILHFAFIPDSPALATVFFVFEIYKSLLPETHSLRNLLEELYAINGVSDLLGFVQADAQYKSDFLRALVKENIFHYLGKPDALRLAGQMDVDTEGLAKFLHENTALFDFQDIYSIGSSYVYQDQVIAAHPKISKLPLAREAFRLIALIDALTKPFATKEYIPKFLVAIGVSEYIRLNPQEDLRYSQDFHQRVSQFLISTLDSSSSEYLT